MSEKEKKEKPDKEEGDESTGFEPVELNLGENVPDKKNEKDEDES